MGELRISIHTRKFDIFCPDGEEDNVRAQAAALSARVAALAQDLDNATDTYLLLLAALTLVEELSDITATHNAQNAHNEKLENAAIASVNQATAKLETFIAAHRPPPRKSK